MMNTVNISLTKEQSSFVDELISRYGFANRSEFFRSLLRLLHVNPQIINQADSTLIEPLNTKDASEIYEDFKKTGKYSKDFLKDLKSGLGRSSYFKK